ncbi:hypothetical protein, conserved [Eimeria necatrix]|uniref:Spo11/DNA topoisomerase VI subunit A N-terminal domain-containing protein n=1 Tax=Eimeria necatrix TaxID=51315 RepID=U6MGE2_9EIME|nr:hypothetical protein, conserved [Eimeria necatrix]CDJ63327.1 hypothetical protein, conserved [Eimeria necatrix]
MESNLPSDGALAPSAESIVSRIESLVLFFLHRISEDPANDSETKVSQDETLFPESFAADNESNTATDSPEFLFPPLSDRSIQRSASLLAIMRTILSLHAEKRYSTLRHVYYSNVTIAPSQRVIDRGVAALTQFLKTPREELRITSTSKCIIKGPIIIQERTYISARSVLWHIRQRFGSQLPIFLLTDFDPHGLLVAMTYAFPPRKATRYSDEAGAFFGVPLSDMSTMSDSKRNLLPGRNSFTHYELFRLDVFEDLPRFIIGAIDGELSADDSEKSCADCSQA